MYVCMYIYIYITILKTRLSTVAGYYNTSVNYILTTVVTALSANPTRRFIWSEIKVPLPPLPHPPTNKHNH